MIKYKINVCEALKASGVSSYRIRKEKIFGEKTLQMLRNGEVVDSMKILNTICKYTHLSPGDILEYVDDDGITEE